MAQNATTDGESERDDKRFSDDVDGRKTMATISLE